MNIHLTDHEIQLTLPDPLYRWFTQIAQERTQDVAEVIQTALEYYRQHFDVTQTRTWELCGAFAVAEPEAAYMQADQVTTNYAENVDAALSRVS